MDTSETFQVQFKGNAQTYFGIWIVNLLLTIVTFGIYSAWAKVRTKKYFAQNTSIDGRRFDYHATGKQILIGRLIVGGGYIAMNVLFSIAPIVGGALFVAFMFAVPYLINRSIAFNARMTSFSGIRFGFTGSYWRAVLVYFVYPFLSLLTLYLTMPFVSRAQHRYYVSRHRYGTAQFAFDSKVGPFYKAFLLAVAWVVGISVVGIVVVAAMIFGSPAVMLDLLSAEADGNDLGIGHIIGMGLFSVLILIAILPAGYIYQAYLRNAVYAGASVAGGHSFTSVVKPAKLLWIALSNAAIVVVTIGLMHPWARVRMARYMAASTYITVEGSMDGIVGEEQVKVSALGDAFTDFEGIDVDFAL